MLESSKILDSKLVLVLKKAPILTQVSTQHQTESIWSTGTFRITVNRHRNQNWNRYQQPSSGTSSDRGNQHWHLHPDGLEPVRTSNDTRTSLISVLHVTARNQHRHRHLDFNRQRYFLWSLVTGNDIRTGTRITDSGTGNSGYVHNEKLWLNFTPEENNGCFFFNIPLNMRIQKMEYSRKID